MGKQHDTSLGEASIGKLILTMSIPSFIGILSYQLYNMVDTIYISRGIGAYAAGGLAVTFPLFILLSAVSNTLGGGAASIISRSLGKKDLEKASQIAANTFGFFWFVAILITIFGSIFLDELLYGMGVTENLLPYARVYMRIILLGTITSTGFSSLIRAEGNSRYAMYLWVIPIIINVILDPIMIFVFRLGVAGAAIATVASQCVSFGMSMHYYFISGKSQLNIKLRHFIPDLRIIGEIVKIGLPTFLQLAGNSLTIIIINNVLRTYGGDLTISTYGMVNKITGFLLVPIQGLLQGVQPIIGYNYGAGMKARVGKALKLSSVFAGCYGVIVSILLFFISEQLMYIFSSEADVIRLGSYILMITNLGMAFRSVQMIQSSFFQSVGQSGIALILTLSNYLLCFIPVILLLSALYGLDGVWFSFPVSAMIALGVSFAFIIVKRREYNEEG